MPISHAYADEVAVAVVVGPAVVIASDAVVAVVGPAVVIVSGALVGLVVVGGGTAAAVAAGAVHTAPY